MRDVMTELEAWWRAGETVGVEWPHRYLKNTAVDRCTVVCVLSRSTVVM